MAVTRLLTPEEHKLNLFNLGYYHLPDHPNSINSVDDLDRITLTSPESVIAIRQFVVNNEQGKTHEQVSGDPDDEALSILSRPRCGFPDYDVPGNPLRVRAEANWPKACRGKLKIARNFPKLPGLTEEETDACFWVCCNNWSTALTDVELVNVGVRQSDSGVQIFATLKRLFGSTLAWSYLAQNSCAVSLDQAYNSGVNWANPLAGLAAAVISHEVGHALGLNHIPGDPDALLYPSVHSAGKARLGYPNASDLSQCRRIGYTPSGLPQPTGDDLWGPGRPDEPGPDPEPPGDKPRLVFRGSFRAEIDGEDAGEFILTPKQEF